MAGARSDGFRPPEGWGRAVPDEAVPNDAAAREPSWREADVAASAAFGGGTDAAAPQAEPETAPAPAPRGLAAWRARRRSESAERDAPEQAPLTASAALSSTPTKPAEKSILAGEDVDEGADGEAMYHLAETVHHQMLTLIVVAVVAVLAILALILNRTVTALKPAPTVVTETATVQVTATQTPVTLASAGGFAVNAISDPRFGTVLLPASQTIVSSDWGPAQADTQLESGIEVIVGLLNSLATATPGATPTDSTTAPAPATPTTTANTYPYGIPSPAGTLSAAARRWIITQDNAAIDRGGSGMRTMTSGYTAWCARSSGQPTRTGEGCFYPTQGGISFIWVWTPPPVTDDVRANLLNSYVPGF